MIDPANDQTYTDELRGIALRLLQEATDALEAEDGSIDPAEVVSVLFSAATTAFKLAMDTWGADASEAVKQWRLLTKAAASEIAAHGAKEKIVLH